MVVPHASIVREASDGGESGVLPVPMVSGGAWLHLASWEEASDPTSRSVNTSPIGRDQRRVSRPSETGWPWLRYQPDPAHLYVSELTALCHFKYSIRCIQNSPPCCDNPFSPIMDQRLLSAASLGSDSGLAT